MKEGGESGELHSDFSIRFGLIGFVVPIRVFDTCVWMGAYVGNKVLWKHDVFGNKCFRSLALPRSF